MKRNEFEQMLIRKYGTHPEYPWKKFPTFAVFRHARNRKWFAVVMTVEKRKFGIDEEGNIDVVNVKCDERILPSFLEQTGVYPAYHMNKAHWLSLVLGETSNENLPFLADLSYHLTENNKSNA
ncbi:MAG: MmcQ/YjbR family DNA-binding protein [Clostridia bacterium]|nr:MmcQ/YjbR family DNA-binding protein [Clostridia bacterium]